MTSETEYLDPEQFPFTESELRAAMALPGPFAAMEQLADDIVRGIREERESRELAAAALARGSRDPAEINAWIYLYPYEVIALLAELSPDLEQRVLAWRLRQRDDRRADRVRQATFRAGLDAREGPPSSINAQLAAEDELDEQRWSALRETVRADWQRLHYDSNS